MKNLIIEFYDTGRMEIWEDKEWTTWKLDGDKLAVKKGEGDCEACWNEVMK